MCLDSQRERAKASSCNIDLTMSYCADFKPADYPTASIAIACLSMVSYLAPDEQKDAFAEFLTSMQASVSINSVSV